MFILANLCTSSSKSQFQQRLLNRDLIILIIKLIQSFRTTSKRLL
jgi:hypothetical protein